MLEKDRKEALDRSEESSVDHYRGMACIVRTHVFQAEPSGGLEVQLDRRDLPGATDRITRLYRNLGAVEGSTALVENEVEAHLLCGLTKRFGRPVPLLVRTDRLALGFCRELEVEVVQSEVAQQPEDELENGLQLTFHLLGGTEDVGVVLGHTADAGQSVDDT